jgi:hypothetical protein
MLDVQLYIVETKRKVGFMFPHTKAVVLSLLCLALVPGGCAKEKRTRFVIKTSYPMVEEAVVSFFEETDPIFAKEAAPANLKLLQGMARGAPDHEPIQLAVSQFMAMYAFGFLEDVSGDWQEQEILNERARAFYLRGREYAIGVLQRHADFKGMLDMNLDDFKKALSVYNKKHVAALLWASFNWGLYINLSRSDVSAVADLSKVGAIAERVIALDEKHYFGSAHLFLMVYYGSVGKAVGGSPEKAKEEYEKAWEIGDGKYLLPKYLFAKTYCLQTLDRELFDKLLQEIVDAPDDLLPEQALTNAIIKVKARRLMNMADDLF